MVISAIQRPKLASALPGSVALPPMWLRSNPSPGTAVVDPCLLYSSVQLELSGCNFLLLESGDRIDLE
jgi:hypothetical protein